MRALEKYIDSRQASVAAIACAILLVAGAGILYRYDSAVRVVFGLAAMVWFSTVPGAVVLLLFHETASRLRFLLKSTVVGLTLFPVIYYAAWSLGWWERFGLLYSALIVAGILAIVFSRRNRGRPTLPSPVSGAVAVSVALLLLASTAAVAVREMTQLLPRELVIHHIQEMDAGYIMGIIVGLKNYGLCVDMFEGAARLSYHHFLYLYLAQVCRVTGLSVLSMYQVVSPLFSFGFLSLGCYALTWEISRSRAAAFAAGIAILFLDDFAVLNYAIPASPSSPIAVYASQNIGNLHWSPSWAYAIAMAFVILIEVHHVLRAREWKWKDLLFLTGALSILAGYKGPVWSCLVAGILLAGLLKYRRSRALILVALSSACAGVLITILSSYSTAKGMMADVLIGFPVLKNAVAQWLAADSGYRLTLHSLTARPAAVILILMPVFLVSVFGVRMAWFREGLDEFRGKAERASIEMIVLCVIFVGVVVSIFGLPSLAANSWFYFTNLGILLSTPFAVAKLAASLREKGHAARTGILLLLTGCQMLTGLVYYIKPFVDRKPFAVLDRNWIEAMTYLKNSTPPNSLILSNRYDLSKETETRKGNTESFFFVPAVAERPLVTGGNIYHMNTFDRGYLRRRALADSLLKETSLPAVERLCAELRVDYIVIDKWKNDIFPGADGRVVENVFRNASVDIYRVGRGNGIR